MREASAEINRLRIEFRERIGAETLEVRQSMDTALQIRRRLADNRIVAMLMDRHVDRDRVAVHLLRPPRVLPAHAGAARLSDGRAAAALRDRPTPDGRYPT